MHTRLLKYETEREREQDYNIKTKVMKIYLIIISEKQKRIGPTWVGHFRFFLFWSSLLNVCKYAEKHNRRLLMKMRLKDYNVNTEVMKIYLFIISDK